MEPQSGTRGQPRPGQAAAIGRGRARFSATKVGMRPIPHLRHSRHYRQQGIG